jgi:hypothetical protein
VRVVADELNEVAHWDCWGSCGMRHADTPSTNTTPEAAMDRLLEHVRLIYGEQDWSSWQWIAREYGTRRDLPGSANRASGAGSTHRGPAVPRVLSPARVARRAA